MATISNKNLLKLAENLRGLSDKDREKYVQQIEARYSPGIVKKLETILKEQFAQFDSQSRKLQQIENVFLGKMSSGNNAVSNREVDDLIQQTQDKVSKELLGKMPAVPTHAIESNKKTIAQPPQIPFKKTDSENNRPTVNPEKATPSTALTNFHAALANARVKVQQYRQNKTDETRKTALEAVKEARHSRNQLSAVKNTVKTQQSGTEIHKATGSKGAYKLAENARKRADNAMDIAKGKIDDYRHKKTPTNRREALKALKSARQLSGHALKMEKKLSAMSRTSQLVNRFKTTMERLHKRGADKPVENDRHSLKRGPK